jgi:hypothetical protein
MEPTPLPTTVSKEGINYTGRDLPMAFKSKIVNLEKT